MKNKLFIKKIISGKYKGVTLNLPSKTTTRSSKSIVLESFFNTLQFDIVDANFVEVFSGNCCARQLTFLLHISLSSLLVAK